MFAGINRNVSANEKDLIEKNFLGILVIHTI